MARVIDQDELDRLFTAALEAALALIEKEGRFFPLLFELRAGGDIQSVAVLERGNLDSEGSVLEHYAEILRPRAAEGIIRASAIAIQHEDWVEVRVRALGHASDLHVPIAVETTGFVRRRRHIALGRIEGAAVRNDIFA